MALASKAWERESHLKNKYQSYCGQTTKEETDTHTHTHTMLKIYVIPKESFKLESFCIVIITNTFY